MRGGRFGRGQELNAEQFPAVVAGWLLMDGNQQVFYLISRLLSSYIS